MPTVVKETLPAPPPLRKRWTRAECDALIANGLLDDPDHLELIEGDLVRKMPKRPPHTNVPMAVLLWLQDAFGRELVVPERTIDVAPQDNPTSAAEPDIVVLARSWREFQVYPQPSDLRLVVEISDSTVAFDRSTKASLYARAAIAEYWVADIPGRRLIVHRDPRDGAYHSVIAYNEGESVTPLAAPLSALPVTEAFSGVPRQ